MKKLLSLVILSCIFLLVGCLDVTQEYTINADGSGVISNKIDMSSAMTMLMQMGGDKAKEEKINVDSVFAFKKYIDTVKTLTAEEKKLFKDAVFGVVMSTEKEKFLITTSIPFKSINDIDRLNAIMKKIQSSGAMSKAVGGVVEGGDTNNSMVQPGGGDEMMKNMAEEYFDMKIQQGLITRKLNKDKYAKLNDDEALSKLKEVGSMGAPIKSSVVINLPRPAKKVEGKNAKVSDDKKKITIETELNDLFDNPANYEFRIEY